MKSQGVRWGSELDGVLRGARPPALHLAQVCAELGVPQPWGPEGNSLYGAPDAKALAGDGGWEQVCRRGSGGGVE